MVIILDAENGKALNFRYRKDAGKYLGVSQPTLRRWLDSPFFLYRKFIITETGYEKIEQGREQLRFTHENR